MNRQVHEMAKALEASVIDWRRSLHARPECSWEEVETTRFVEQRLREWGLTIVQRGFADTECGLVADLNPDKNPCVALRADIDALPVQEETGVSYASTVPGAMHACGHDGHVACLLGAAKVLADLGEAVPGRVRFIFQPAEEKMADSGAGYVIRAGLLQGVSAIGGMHLASFLPSGVVGVRSGALMAAGGTWKVVFSGKGGHGGMPHATIDPTLPAATFIMALQTLVSRENHPAAGNVVSVGTMRAGHAPNVIPDTVTLTGTIRTFNFADRTELPVRLEGMAQSLAHAYRCMATFTLFPGGTTVVDNDVTLETLFEACAREVVGDERVKITEPVTISEDFSFYQEEVPGVFFFLGVGNEAKQTAFPHHSPRFNIDESNLGTGVELLSSFALKALQSFADQNFARK